MRLEAATCSRLFAASRVARLATSGPSGPHIVPIVFTLDSGRLITVVDAKPKTTRRLQRLANIADDPRVAVLADHFADDWSQLWWVRADGNAVISDDVEQLEPAVTLLGAKYPQYREQAPPGPLITVTIERWVGWAATSEAVDRL